MNKAILYSLLALGFFLALAGCKKDHISYPAVFRYSGVGDLSGITTYDSTGQINAPNSPSARSPYLVHFQDSVLPEIVADYTSDDGIVLENDHRIRLFGNGFDSTFDYVRSGDKLLITHFYPGVLDTIVYQLAGNQLKLAYTAYAIDQGSLTGYGYQLSEPSSQGPFSFFNNYWYTGNAIVAQRTFNIIFTRNP